MTAKYVYITDTGVTNADTVDLLEDVREEWKSALGQNLNVNSATAQGTLIEQETLARSGVMKNNAELANVINPNYSYGTFLDATCAFLGVERGKDQSTVATGVRINGNSQTSIQRNSRVQTPAGDIFQITDDIVIPIAGFINVSLKSAQPGDIPLPVGELKIIDGSIGWGSIFVEVGTSVFPGFRALVDVKLKNARNEQLAIQGRGGSAAVKALVSAVPNVTSVSVVENNTGAIGVVNGVTFTLPNAMWVCVAGNPDPAAVAAALYQAHQSACPWDFGAVGEGVKVDSPNGTLVIDPSTGMPYRVKSTTPIKYDAYVIADVSQGSSATSPTEAVQNAVVNYAAGNTAGEPGLVVGADVSAFEIGGAIARALPGLYVKNVAVAVVLAGAAPPLPGAYSTEKVMKPYEEASISVGNVKVNIV
jgi:hypothetical protein